MADREKKTEEKTKATGKLDILAGMPPEWADTTAISKLLGKTTRRIQQLTQDGVLETERPPGGGARKYRTCETVKRYIANVEQKAQETGESSRTAELNLKKLTAEVELKESQGQLHRMKTAIAEGKYILADQASEELADFMATFKRFALSVPNRVGGTVAGYTDAATARAVEKSLRKDIEITLAIFVDAAMVEPKEGAP